MKGTSNIFRPLILLILFLSISQYGVSQAWEEAFRIDGNGPGQWLGNSVDISDNGKIVAIGSPYGPNPSVFIFELNNGDWNLTDTIDESHNADGEGFSVSLNADGNRIAVGHNNAANGVLNQSGMTRVYQRIGSNWVQLGGDLYGEAAGNWSGGSVNLNAAGTRLAVGAIGNDDAFIDAGHVRVYEYGAAGWTQIGQDIDGLAAHDSFGWTVALSGDGNRLIASSFTGVPDYAIVYEYDGLWKTIGSQFNGSNIGDDLSMNYDGSKVIISVNSSAAEVYELDQSIGDWLLLGSEINVPFPGRASVDINASGNSIVVGNGNDSSLGLAVHGSTSIFNLSEGEWSLVDMIINHGEGENYGFDVAISSSGGVVVAGGLESGGDYSGMAMAHQYLVPISCSSFEEALIDLDIDSQGLLDGQILLNDAWNMESLDLSNTSLDCLDGIEYFSNLISLNLSDNDLNINCLDLSSLTKLKELNTLGNPISVVVLDNIEGVSSDPNFEVEGETEFATTCPFFFSTREAEILSVTESKLVVYPNPADNNVQIVTDDQDFNEALIFDQSGRFVLKSLDTNFDISSLSHGLYFLKVRFDNKEETHKLIIKKNP